MDGSVFLISSFRTLSATSSGVGPCSRQCFTSCACLSLSVYVPRVMLRPKIQTVTNTSVDARELPSAHCDTVLANKHPEPSKQSHNHTVSQSNSQRIKKQSDNQSFEYGTVKQPKTDQAIATQSSDQVIKHALALASAIRIYTPVRKNSHTQRHGHHHASEPSNPVQIKT